MYGDIVAQLYFHALRKASSLSEKSHPQLPDNPQCPTNFENFLFNHTRQLNEFLCEAAKNGRLVACQGLWEQA